MCREKKIFTIISECPEYFKTVLLKCIFECSSQLTTHEISKIYLELVRIIVMFRTRKKKINFIYIYI